MSKTKKFRRVTIPVTVQLHLQDGRPAKRHSGEYHWMSMGEFMVASPLEIAEPFGNGTQGLRRQIKLSDMFETADPGTTVDLEIDDWDAIKDALSKVKFNSTALSRQMMPFIEAIEQAELIEVPRQPVLAP